MGIWSIYHDFMHWFWTVFPRIVFSNVLNENLEQVEKYKVNPIEITHSNSIIEAMRVVYKKTMSLIIRKNWQIYQEKN